MIKQVIVVRKDLNMRKGKIAAQTAHASMKVLLDLMPIVDHINETNEFWTTRELVLSKDNPLEEWLSGSFTKIVVSCDSLDELEAIEKECIDKEIHHAKIIDNGWTEFKGVPTVTCLAVGPEHSEVIDKITGHLKLL